MQLPRQYIHVQPFSTDNDLPDYDLDEEDCAFLDKVLKDEKKFDVDESTFEGMLDRSVNEGKTIGFRASTKGRSWASVSVRRSVFRVRRPVRLYHTAFFRYG